MIPIEGGSFLMGTQDTDSIAADGEGPIRECSVDSFYLNRYTVTNEQFREFVRATGYVTEAQRFGWSFVFRAPVSSQEADPERAQVLRWWRPVDGATWDHPEGPDSGVGARANYPVVQASVKRQVHNARARLKIRDEKRGGYRHFAGPAKYGGSRSLRRRERQHTSALDEGTRV